MCVCGVRCAADEGESKQAYKNGKPVCRYGATCYRVNPDHRKQFWHPSKAEAGDHAPQSKGKTQQTTPGRKPAPTPMTAGRGGGDDDDDAISEEEDGAAKQSDKDRDAAGKVKTLSAMSAFRELDPGIIRDVLEANNSSLPHHGGPQESHRRGLVNTHTHAPNSPPNFLGFAQKEKIPKWKRRPFTPVPTLLVAPRAKSNPYKCTAAVVRLYNLI